MFAYFGVLYYNPYTEDSEPRTQSLPRPSPAPFFTGGTQAGGRAKSKYEVIAL